MSRPTRVAEPPELLALLADPVRWRLVQELALSDLRVSELTDRAGRPQNLVSYHLRQLRDAGLVAARRSSADGRDTYYSVDLARCGQLLAAAGAALHPGVRLGPVRVELRPVPVARRPRVLFLCTGNSARSQIAEALLESMSGDNAVARSAGSHPKVLHPNAVRVMSERGVDIAGRRAKHLRRYAAMRFDQVITLCDRVREVCPQFPHHPTLVHWSMGDPSLEGDSDDATYPAFERTAQELEQRIGFLLPRLLPSTYEQEPAHVR